MAKDKASFLFYCNWLNTFEAITDEQAGKLIKHLLRYVNDLDPETDDQLINALFQQFKFILKQDLDKYEATRKKNSENARKRWHATASDGTNRNANNADKDNVKGNVTDTVKDINKSIEGRKQVFFTHINQVNDSDIILQPEDLKEFLEYWTEHGLKDKKMRFEKEKSFAAARRLKTWAKNKIKFGQNDTGNKKGAYGAFLDSDQ